MAWARDDLQWFAQILRYGTLRGVPTRLFSGQLPRPDVHLYMDTSNYAACILDPARRKYIIIIFDESEHTLMATQDTAVRLDINIREQFCIAVAATLLAPAWSSALSQVWPHIQCWTDNQTAMARTNVLGSNHGFAQNLNRCIGLAEAQHRFRISAAHLPGTQNILADAGSRLNVDSSKAIFTNGVYGWTQMHVPDSTRYIYKDFSTYFKPHHWPGAHEPRTIGLGGNGALGAHDGANNRSCRAHGEHTPKISSRSPWIAGPVQLSNPEHGLDRAVQD